MNQNTQDAINSAHGIITFFYICVLLLIFNSWTFRIAKVGDFSSKKSRGQIFRSLSLRITWRYALANATFLSIITYVYANGANQSEESTKLIAAILVFTILAWPLVFLNCWRLSGYFKIPNASAQPTDKINSSTKKPDFTESTHAEALELKSPYTINEIEASYIKIIKRYHPDNIKDLGEDFIELSQAKLMKANTAYLYFKKKSRHD